MVLTLDSHSVAPILKGERYVVMDVLRGFALLGVMTMNLHEFGGVDVLITAEQLANLPSAALDERLAFCLQLFVYKQGQHAVRFPVRTGFLGPDGAPSGARRAVPVDLSATRWHPADPRVDPPAVLFSAGIFCTSTASPPSFCSFPESCRIERCCGSVSPYCCSPGRS